MSVAPTNYKVLSNWRKTSAATTYGFVTVASSSDGTILAAGIEPTGLTGQGVLISLDSGNTWTPYGPTNYHVSSIALSADGSKIVVVGDYSVNPAFYISQSPFTTWTTPSSIPATDWASITCSDDFQYLAAAIFSGATGIWVSSDFGTTFAATSASVSSWLSITSSSDGQKIAAVDNMYIYTSISPFTTWTQQTTSLGSLMWVSITCASNFSILFAVVENAGIWKSIDSGTTWTQTSAPNKDWYSITCSNDGTIVAAVAFTNFIWISIDSGTTWIQSSAPSSKWESIACSGDGLKLVAAHYGDPSFSFVYTGTLFADLADLFQALPPGVTQAITTNYNVPTLGDLNNVFAPLSFGTSIGFNTQYTVSNADLSTIFAAKIFSITPASIYSSSYSGGYYTIALTRSGTISSGTITFYQNLTGIEVVAIGGGGGGGSNYYSGTFSSEGGGGGGAGGSPASTIISITANTSYSFTIGAGGGGGASAGNGQQGGTTTFDSFLSASGGLGGNKCITKTNGGAGAPGFPGAGGTGGNFNDRNSFNGVSGLNYNIGGTNYYFGGGGAGGSYDGQGSGDTTTRGGRGGGGGSGTGVYGNDGQDWTSPTGTPYYPVGYDTPAWAGWPSTGGGGAGGNGTSDIPGGRNGGNGGSGIVVLHFQYP
jgi:hypothetical protein